MTPEPEPSPPLPAREGYRLWAAGYHHETVVSALDERAVSRFSPPAAGRRLLDAGCGTGRRLRAAAAGARRAVGVDLVPEMLRAGRSDRGEGADATDGGAGAGAGAPAASRVDLVAGDLRALPLRSGAFDLVWCRLAVGHVAGIDAVYAELGRVAAHRADLVVSDFHPAAAAAGHVRSFRDDAGALRTLVHHVHSEDDHRRAAAAAGWTVAAVESVAPGAAERPFYERAGRADDFDAHRDLPLVLALCLTR